MKLLITRIETFRKHVSNIAVTLKIEQLEGEIRTATIDFIIPYIGMPLYDRLCDMVPDQPEEPSASATPGVILIEKLQAALSNYVALRYTPISDTFFTAMGLQTFKSETQVGAFAYQKADRMAKYAADADTLMDDALSYLEDHLADFPEYSRDEPQWFRHWAFPTARDFSRFYGIGNSRRTFLRLLPIIRKVETLELLPVLGQEKHTALVDFCNNNVVTPDFSKQELTHMRELCRGALANLTMERAVLELNVRLVDDTVQLASFVKSDNSGPNCEVLSSRAGIDGQAFLSRLKDLSVRNDASFCPDFSNNHHKKHFII